MDDIYSKSQVSLLSKWSKVNRMTQNEKRPFTPGLLAIASKLLNKEMNTSEIINLLIRPNLNCNCFKVNPKLAVGYGFRRKVI
jgi:hypothetical protein